MEEEKKKQEMTETDSQENLNTPEGWRGPTWSGWVLSILVAILLSVTATLLLGGSGAFRSDCAIGPAAGHNGSGVGSGCCLTAGVGK